LTHPGRNREQAPEYRAFVLRLWREHPDTPWRCSLQAADGAERLGFADLEQLLAYLLRLADDDTSAPRGPPTTGPPW